MTTENEQVAAPGKVSLQTIQKYFGLTTREFSETWRLLPDKDKADLRIGFENGSMTY